MSRIVPVVLAALVAIAPAAASAAPKGAVPKPAVMDAKGIDEWRKAYIEAEGWALVHADGAALTYAGGPTGVKPDKDGFLRADVRREYYKSVSMGPSSSRSNLQNWILDCELRRMKVLAMSFWSLNNMKGTGFRKAADDTSWITVEAGSPESGTFDRICAVK